MRYSKKKNYIDAIIRSNRKLLEDFCIDFTKSMEQHIRELYPDELAIDRYIRKLIKDKLEG